MSLRLQNEGQKSSRIAQMHTESLTRIFFFLCSLIYLWIQNGFASVPACGCCDSDCRVICYYFAYIYHRTNSGKTYPYLSSDNICYKNKEKRQISLFPFCRIRKIIYLCPVFSPTRQLQPIQHESVIRTCMEKDCNPSLKGTINVLM